MNQTTQTELDTRRLRTVFWIVALATVGLIFDGYDLVVYDTVVSTFLRDCYRTNVRGAGVAWCAGFGRLGGAGGPLLGGFLISGGFALNSIFYVLAGLAVLGVMLTLIVPMARRLREPSQRLDAASSPPPHKQINGLLPPAV
jgi:MFS transporter, AAHS family, benzoate transport protein